MSDISKCPVMGGTRAQNATATTSNEQWWPNQLNLRMLRQQSSLSDPMGTDFDYVKEFKTLDLDA